MADYITIKVKVGDELYDWLDNISCSLNIPMSEIIIMAVKSLKHTNEETGGVAIKSIINSVTAREKNN